MKLHRFLLLHFRPSWRWLSSFALLLQLLLLLLLLPSAVLPHKVEVAVVLKKLEKKGVKEKAKKGIKGRALTAAKSHKAATMDYIKLLKWQLIDENQEAKTRTVKEKKERRGRKKTME